MFRVFWPDNELIEEDADSADICDNGEFDEVGDEEHGLQFGGDNMMWDLSLWDPLVEDCALIPC